MKQSKYSPQLKQLLQKPVFKASDARDLGIPARMLAHYSDRGIIERMSRGIYRTPGADTGMDLAIEDLILTAASIPHGIVCMISALCLYAMTDQLMREYWIAIPNADRSPKRPHVRIVRMRNVSLGLTQIKIGDHAVKIFDRERTVVDAFRFLSHEIAIKALQAYLKTSSEHKPDLVKLSRYAKSLKVDLTPYIMALTT